MFSNLCSFCPFEFDNFEIFLEYWDRDRNKNPGWRNFETWIWPLEIQIHSVIVNTDRLWFWKSGHDRIRKMKGEKSYESKIHRTNIVAHIENIFLLFQRKLQTELEDFKFGSVNHRCKIRCWENTGCSSWTTNQNLNRRKISNQQIPNWIPTHQNLQKRTHRFTKTRGTPSLTFSAPTFLFWFYDLLRSLLEILGKRYPTTDYWINFSKIWEKAVSLTTHYWINFGHYWQIGEKSGISLSLLTTELLDSERFGLLTTELLDFWAIWTTTTEFLGDSPEGRQIFWVFIRPKGEKKLGVFFARRAIFFATTGFGHYWI